MKTETRQVYWCSFCHKLYLRKNYCERHEELCSKNPENDRACFHCVYLERKSTEYFYSNGDSIELVDLLHCKKLQCFLYPPQVEKKGNAFDLGDEINMPMKVNCEFLDTGMF